MADLACVGKIRLSFGLIWFQAFSDRKRNLAAFLGLDHRYVFRIGDAEESGGTVETSIFFEGGSLWGDIVECYYLALYGL